MSLHRWCLASVCVLALLTACTNTELTNRYDSARFQTSTEKFTSVTAFAQEPPKAPAQNRNVFDLSHEGQAALISAVAANSTPDALLERLGRPIAADEKRSGIVDRTRFKRRVVFAVQHTDKVDDPGDRIDRLSVTLTLSDASGKAQFASWDRFVSAYETVDLGKVTFAKTHEFTAGVSGGPDPTETIPVSVDARYTGTRSLTEELSLRQRYVALAGALAPRSATLWQQGVVGIDLAGTFTVDLELLTSTATPSLTNCLAFAPLFKANQPVPQADVAIQAFFVQHHPAEAITATLSGRSRLRHIDCDADSVVEGDDNVTFLSSPVDPAPASLELVSVRDVEVRGWKIQHIPAGGGPTSYLVLDGYGEINFASYREAEAFLDWVRKTPVPAAAGGAAPVFLVGNRRLDLQGGPLTDADRSGLSVFTFVMNP